MKNTAYILIIFLTLAACQQRNEFSSVEPENWNKRMPKEPLPEMLDSGATYLSVYSEVYSMSEHSTHTLTATVSMRNTSLSAPMYVSSARYFNTHGELIRTYFSKPIVLNPMETVEIVIDEDDLEGGTGANFFFEWKAPPNTGEPFFEAVMISTYGQQGLSFTTRGKRVY